MEWSKEKTLKLIELMQEHASLWNPSLCDTRRDKQKRKEQLRYIAEYLGISMPDATKKIQHLRTQYNRESSREARANVEDPNNKYISSWYAFEYLHFLKDPNKSYTVLQTSDPDGNLSIPGRSDSSVEDCKFGAPPQKITKLDTMHSIKPEVVYQSPRDEFTVFGEYIANELRSLKAEKHLLIAKKKIQDIIFEVKMGLVGDRLDDNSCHIYKSPQNNIQNSKIFTPIMSTTGNLETLSVSHTPPTSGISEIIINSGCHYSSFKVDTQ